MLPGVRQPGIFMYNCTEFIPRIVLPTWLNMFPGVTTLRTLQNNRQLTNILLSKVTLALIGVVSKKGPVPLLDLGIQCEVSIKKLNLHEVTNLPSLFWELCRSSSVKSFVTFFTNERIRRIIKQTFLIYYPIDVLYSEPICPAELHQNLAGSTRHGQLAWHGCSHQLTMVFCCELSSSKSK